MKKILALLLAITVFAAGAAFGAPRKRPPRDKGSKWTPKTHPMIDAARKGAPREYAAARKSGADLVISPNERTFSIVWSPKGGGNKHDAPVIVIVNDEEGWAFEDFDQWYPVALERGYGLIVVQWWVVTEYISDDELYAAINGALNEMKAEAKNKVMLYGAGKGATRAYALEYLDRKSNAPWFSMAVAAAGAKPTGDVLYDTLTKKQLGATPFAGSNWITYCAIRDTKPDTTGCSGMRKTADWLKDLGATVSLSLEDPSARDNEFLRNPHYLYQVLDLFAPSSGPKN